MAIVYNPDNDAESFEAQVRSNGSDSIKIRANLETDSGSSSTEATRYVYLVLKDGSTTVAKEWIESAQTSGNEFNFPGPEARDYAYIDGLDPDTEYTWTLTVAWGTNSDSLSSWAILEGTVTTDEETIIVPTIDTWSWPTKEYNILLGKSPMTDGFSSDVWNDFVDKVMEMRTVADISGEWMTDSGKYLTYAECKVSAGDTLSAEIYNAVKVQIGSIKSTGILDVSAEDELTGYHIIQITDVLNEIIEGGITNG